ncbi:MAG TPA: valine--tRNA ligase [Chloroflexota bacterium]|nr:valine--tRNA ligase [Chloroflexota bacterium]
MPTENVPAPPTDELPKAYNHADVEERLYQFWLERGYFTPTIDESQHPFVIVIPPPNITGVLHHGSAMFVSLQDLMARWRRMQGRPTLWLPGTDHAGIATQNVVEAELAKQGVTRFDLGREMFVERVWEWKEKYGSIIVEQLKRLGASCDWTRERFTLDEGLSRAVRVAFVGLYEKGLVYRGIYIVNWCPRCTTTLSDLEVEHEERTGHLWYIRYPLVDDDDQPVSGEFVIVATTRPETMLGDTGVAVNPHDERYQHLIGQRVLLPRVGRLIPIVGDDAIQPEFGTGAVKVTPAHDPTDAQIGARHQLEPINVMNPDATINENGGRYQGMDRYAAREELLRDLETDGVLVKTEEHTHAVGECSRCGTVIEPRLSEEWFVRMQPLAEPALEVVRDGRIRIIPERFSRVYVNWMENLRDWPISRQLWWGHRIPVWYCDACDETIVRVEEPDHCPSCHGAIRQDEDVLDTWFSSALWPFSTLGWPDDTPDLRYFYPTDVMETGYDILPLWVSRMIMFGLEFTGQPPFSDVYLHGMVRHTDGSKISKSNYQPGDDPLDVINMYGADALRFTLVTSSTPGNDLRLSLERVEGARNFANKLWNAARFVRRSSQQLGAEPTQAFKLDPIDLVMADRWILSRANAVTAEVTRLLEDYLFGEAGRTLYDFIWGEFCDWYIEIAKIRLYGGADERARLTTQAVLHRVLDTIVRLLHPFMPFVTEELWQHLPHEGESLMVAPWPEAGERDPEAEREMGLLMDIVRALRNARTEYKVEPGRKIEAICVAGDADAVIERESAIITTLASVQPLRIVRALAVQPEHALHLIAGGVEVYLPFAGMIDLAAEQRRLESDISQTTEQIERLRARLRDPQFVGKARADVVERERARLLDLEERQVKLSERRRALE